MVTLWGRGALRMSQWGPAHRIPRGPASDPRHNQGERPPSQWPPVAPSGTPFRPGPGITIVVSGTGEGGKAGGGGSGLRGRGLHTRRADGSPGTPRLRPGEERHLPHSGACAGRWSPSPEDVSNGAGSLSGLTSAGWRVWPAASASAPLQNKNVSSETRWTDTEKRRRIIAVATDSGFSERLPVGVSPVFPGHPGAGGERGGGSD